MIGLFVLCVTVIEGAGNSWLGLGVIDAVPRVRGTGQRGAGRLPRGHDRGPVVRLRPSSTGSGRVPVLRAGVAVACGGLLLLGFSAACVPSALACAALTGLGVSLGYPVGMSAAADDPRRAAGRSRVASCTGIRERCSPNRR